jgi:hypothetical protein
VATIHLAYGLPGEGAWQQWCSSSGFSRMMPEVQQLLCICWLVWKAQTRHRSSSYALSNVLLH